MNARPAQELKELSSLDELFRRSRELRSVRSKGVACPAVVDGVGRGLARRDSRSTIVDSCSGVPSHLLSRQLLHS